jgi:hypothetical protein
VKRAVATFLVSLSAAVWLATPRAFAQSLVRDDFEGPEIALRDAGGDASYRLEAQARVAQGARSGQWCERLTVRGNNGTYVYVAHPLAPASVISELAIGVWLKADRPGLQLLARVTLPRSADPRTGKPLTTLVRGSAYAQVGVWQQLRLDNLPQSLERQVRVMRVQLGRDVDAREAYVDRVLLNVYGGPGLTTVWVDDLEVAGVVSPQATAQAASSEVAQSDPRPSTRDLPAIWVGSSGVPSIERSGSLLLVGGKPFFPRIIEYQGESLARLKALGFNAVWLARVPTAEFMRDASAAGLWLVAPPPPADELAAPSGGATKIGGQFDPVLAWDLGHGLAASQLEATKRLANLVRAADPRGRPMACQADSELMAYTRPPIHLLVARRDVLGTSFQLSQYIAWLRERAQLAMPGTTLWATIQTQPPAPLVEQIALLSPGQAPTIALAESQVRALVHAALAGGARGLCFQSRSRLDAADSQTRRRAAILELVNLELDLIERWPASGTFATTADSSDPHAIGAVIETDRSRLLLPMYAPANSQWVMGTTTAAVVNYTVRGVPEGDNAYELSLSSFRPLDSKRVAGGTRVLLGELERDSLVVFTDYPLVIRELNARLNQSRRRAAALVREIAAGDQVAVEVGSQRLAALGHDIPATRPPRIAVQNDLRQYDALLAKGDVAAAYYQARHALANLRLIERMHFEEATSGSLPLGDPRSASFATLAEHVRFTSELASAPKSPNRLPEGGCEDLSRMIQAGWKHYRHPRPGIATAVDLSPQVARSGRAGLRLRATAENAGNQPAAIESPPMWVTTAPLPVERGQLVEIQAQVRVAKPIAGSVDGLLMIDSLTGETMAQRLGQGADWQQLSVYRAVGQSGPMVVTFALCGLGEVWIDDVSVRVIARPGSANPLEQAQQTRPPAYEKLAPRSLTGG